MEIIDMENAMDSTHFPQPYFKDEIIHLINDINVMFQKLYHAFYSPYGLTLVQIPVLMTAALRSHDGFSAGQTVGNRLQ